MLGKCRRVGYIKNMTVEYAKIQPQLTNGQSLLPAYLLLSLLLVLLLP